eukprot:8517406-Pyramimonas_sp.AAC.1
MVAEDFSRRFFTDGVCVHVEPYPSGFGCAMRCGANDGIDRSRIFSLPFRDWCPLRGLPFGLLRVSTTNESTQPLKPSKLVCEYEAAM